MRRQHLLPKQNETETFLDSRKQQNGEPFSETMFLVTIQMKAIEQDLPVVLFNYYADQVGSNL